MGDSVCKLGYLDVSYISKTIIFPSIGRILEILDKNSIYGQTGISLMPSLFLFSSIQDNQDEIISINWRKNVLF